MRIRVLAVGTRMPDWVNRGVSEYLQRLPREFRVDMVEIAPAKRQGGNPGKFRRQEAEAIARQVKSSDRLVALDVQGKALSTEDMASQLREWAFEPGDVALLIGGPDGLDPDLLARCRQRWSLGRITLPHPLVRVVLSEQLYRAWSINAGHPYHRA